MHRHDTSKSARELPAHQIAIGQGTANKQAVGVLLQPAVSDLHETEDAFDNTDTVLDPRPRSGLDAVARTLGLIDLALVVIMFDKIQSIEPGAAISLP